VPEHVDAEIVTRSQALGSSAFKKDIVNDIVFFRSMRHLEAKRGSDKRLAIVASKLFECHAPRLDIVLAIRVPERGCWRRSRFRKGLCENFRVPAPAERARDGAN
jgi:hypothetical protein